MFSRSICLIAALCWTVAEAHTVLTYPGWRGDNLVTNETYPYGMQWMYPCGGHYTTTNRTKWPVTGGAIALQPGWFQGHATAFFYMNIGFGTDGPDHGPPNMSFPMVPVFQIVGPSKNPYPGTFCLPQVPLPNIPNFTVNVGDNATIQVVETAIHGAALYSCVDITFALPEDVDEVNETNCFNSSDISFNNVFSTAISGNTASSASKTLARASFWPVAALLMFTFL
ncbi:Uncharacterized protein BP5553_01655 [Venustampulla echinocandica]|uniref:Copper acquisition factor BIM1-like domain-containing protein n=1 Tax=Venustampulla echinocandica TaxID=2656787 RepID=A0A370U1M2_9HELO|nr:Uncharacterized protein BP5553_01655 [Venustampulla echinocandica]RDL41676.1 Uncharacterized protein BP5553_01655 [Venustampulla echinocandica]